MTTARDRSSSAPLLREPGGYSIPFSAQLGDRAAIAERDLLLGLSRARLAERDRTAQLGVLTSLDEQALVLVDEHPHSALERVPLQTRLAHDKLPFAPRVLLHLLGQIAESQNRLLDLLLADLRLVDPPLERGDFLLEEVA